MTSDPAPGKKPRRTTLVPVTTMEEIPILSEKEKAKLISALQAAEKRIEAGHALEFEPKTFKRRLIDIYRKAKR